SCVHVHKDYCTCRRSRGFLPPTSRRYATGATPKTYNGGSDAPSCFSSSCFPREIFAVKIDEQVGRFVDAHAMQLRRVEFRREALPDGDGEVLGRRNSGKKLRHFLVQEAMVERVEHFPAHDVLQLLQVNDESRLRIDGALHGHFQGVVVPVPVGVVALAEDALVLLRSEFRIVIEVRCGKFRFACEIDHRDSFQLSALSFQSLILNSWNRFCSLHFGRLTSTWRAGTVGTALP